MIESNTLGPTEGVKGRDGRQLGIALLLEIVLESGQSLQSIRDSDPWRVWHLWRCCCFSVITPLWRGPFGLGAEHSTLRPCKKRIQLSP